MKIYTSSLLTSTIHSMDPCIYMCICIFSFLLRTLSNPEDAPYENSYVQRRHWSLSNNFTMCICMYMYYTILSVTIYIIIQPEKIQQIYFSVLSFVFGVLPDALKQVRTVVAYCRVALTWPAQIINYIGVHTYMQKALHTKQSLATIVDTKHKGIKSFH